MARFKYFLPMYPLGHIVSLTSSIGMTSGSEDLVDAYLFSNEMAEVCWRPITIVLFAVALGNILTQ